MLTLRRTRKVGRIVATITLAGWLSATPSSSWAGKLRVIGSGPNRELAFGTLHGSFCRKGIPLYVVDTEHGIPLEGSEAIGVCVRGRIRHIDHLDELRGFVRIRNKDAALQYVRLLTSLSTYFMWPGHSQIEIVDQRAIPRTQKSGASGGSGEISDPTGYAGFLSDRDFKKYGFYIPTATAVPGGYVIRRWILTWESGNVVEQVQEWVGTNGSYLRTIISRRTSSEFKDIHWYIPTFE